MYFVKCQVFSLIIFLLVSICYGTVVRSCGEVPIPSVNLTNCEIEPCEIPADSSIDIELSFISPETSPIIKSKTVAKIGSFITITFGISNTGCDLLINGECPIQQGEMIHYKRSMSFLNYPEVAFTLIYELLSDDNATLTCFQVDCNIIGGITEIPNVRL